MLLWESAPSTYVPFFVKGKDSPTSFNAAVALAVKTTVYSGGARKNASTLSRASRTHSALIWALCWIDQTMVARKVAEFTCLLLTEWVFPRMFSCKNAECMRMRDSG